jgi:hypothetical protein
MAFYYIIPTTEKYKDITLPRLLSSLKTEHQIIVAINDCETSEVLRGDIITYRSTNSSFEYIAPMAAIELLNPEDRFFWLHDTCEAGPEFNTLVTGVINDKIYNDFEYIDIYNGYCNFGIYSVEFLMRDKDWLLSQKNITKDQAITNEMRYWNSSKKKRRFPGRGLLEYSHSKEKDIYGTGHPRLVEYYGSIDLFKFKANTGWKGKNWVTVL